MCVHSVPRQFPEDIRGDESTNGRVEDDHGNLAARSVFRWLDPHLDEGVWYVASHLSVRHH